MAILAIYSLCGSYLYVFGHITFCAYLCIYIYIYIYLYIYVYIKHVHYMVFITFKNLQVSAD